MGPLGLRGSLSPLFIFELLTPLQTVPFILWVAVAEKSGWITSKKIYVPKFHLLSRDFIFLMSLAIGDKDFFTD